jgi:hypothetical protein
LPFARLLIFRNDRRLHRQEPALLNERDTVNADGTFNRAAILRIARVRAAAERDLDVLIAAHGPTLRLPAGIGLHNVANWRRDRAAKIDRAGLVLTPFRKLLAAELRRAWQAARVLRAALARERETGGTAALALSVHEAA